MITSFSKHKINSKTEINFDPALYSRFKFGNGNIAKQFGAELAESFIHSFSDLLLSGKEIVAIPSPYNAIPTASNVMTEYFIKELNAFLFRHDKPSVMISKIHRYKTYTEDYGNLSFNERISLISTDTYHIDKLFLEDRICLFIDDIKITGGHELIIRNLLTTKKIQAESIFVYFAELVNKDIEPSFENYLNYAFVQNMHDVVAVINASDFVYNTRVIKYILNSAVTDVNLFCKEVSIDKIEKLIEYAISNNYHQIGNYKTALQIITKFANYGNQSSKRPERSNQCT
ncbi:MAG TPA: phosphoribosyltransferase family protein [Niastella sp.]